MQVSKLSREIPPYILASTFKYSPTVRKSIVRTSFVTEERAEKNVDFNNPEDQKVMGKLFFFVNLGM